MLRKIVKQDTFHQYDEDGNAITTWDNIKCVWIVEPKFEKDIIDWDLFQKGITLEKFKEQNPNWDKKPVIVVEWTYNEESFKKAFPGHPFSKTIVRDWNYINYSKEEAILRLGKYAGFYKYADNVRITYDGKEIFNEKKIEWKE